MTLTALEILSNACVLLTIALFSTGIPQCFVMIKQKDTENIPFLPYIMTFVNNAIWVAYSMLIDNWTVYIVNAIGAALQITYISVYMFYTGFRVKELQMIIIAAAFTSFVVLYVYFVGDSSFSTNVVGILCNVVTILMFSSPLAELRTAIQEKSTKTISFPLTVATFFCTLSWTVYGILIKDMYLIIPNALGLLTSLPRFYVFGRFRATQLVMALRLVINADDLGYSEERDLGIFQCFLRGRSISSTSVLANGATAASALSYAVQIGLPVGLHFNITEGEPLSSPQTLPTLAKNGLFLGRFPFMEQIDNGKINSHEIEEELMEQIKWFENITGCLPDHVDGHQHVHVMPGVRKVFAEVMQRKGIKWTRVPHEICDTNECSDTLRYVLANCKASADVFTFHDLRFTASFVGISVMGRNMSLDRLSSAIACNIEHATSDNNACELMVHPGYVCKGIGGCGSGPDDFSKSEDREYEMALLQSSEWKNFISSKRFLVCSFNDLSA